MTCTLTCIVSVQHASAVSHEIFQCDMLRLLVRHTNEFPALLAALLTIHSASRPKNLIENKQH